MKRVVLPPLAGFFLLGILAFCPHPLKAYQPMFQKTTWIISGGTLGTFFGYHYLYKQCDTLIGGIQYQIIHNYTGNTRVGLFREDSASQKVYIHHGGYERLLYDFSLNTGDYITVHLNSYHTPTLRMQAVKVDTVVIGGLSRKRIKLSGGFNYDPFQITWIEGCGSTQGIIYDDFDRYCLFYALECVYHGLNLNFCRKEFEHLYSGANLQYECPKLPIDFTWQKNCTHEPTLITFNPYQNQLNGVLNFGDGSEPYQVSGKEILSHTYASQGSYTVGLFIWQDSIFHDSMSIQIPVYAPAAVNLMNDTQLCNQTSFQLYPDSVIAMADYLWRDPVNRYADTLLIHKSGYYKVTQYLGTCPPSSDSVAVDFINSDLVELGPDRHLCVGDSVQFSVDPGYTSIHWSDGSSMNSLSLGKINTDTVVKVTVNYGVCSISDSAIIFVHDYPELIDMPDTSYCDGDTLILEVQLEKDMPIEWSNQSIGAKAKFHAPGEYWVQVSNKNCKSKSGFYIEKMAKPVVDLGPDTTLCRLQGILLKSEAPYPKSWSTGAVADSVLVYPPQTISLTVRNQLCSTTDTLNILIAPPNYRNLFNDTTLCFWNQTLVLSAGIADFSHYHFSSTGDTALPIVHPGLMEITLENPDGCIIRDQIFVTEDCPEETYIPSVFSPNNDGLNDEFRLDTIPKSNFRVEIYSRWGQRVYSSQEAGFHWDGSIDGIACPEGVYVYRISFDLPNRKRQNLTGTLTLIR